MNIDWTNFTPWTSLGGGALIRAAFDRYATIVEPHRGRGEDG